MGKHSATRQLARGAMAAILLIGMISASACAANRRSAAGPAGTEIRVGYCPTMGPFVNALAEGRPDVVPVEYENAAMVLQALHGGVVQAAVIGRIARGPEITEELALLRLEDGLTLIAAGPGMIFYEDLASLTVLTIEDKTAVSHLFPPGTNISFYQHLDQILLGMGGMSVALLRWSEVSPDHHLLIPVDLQGYKLSEFRSAHFYYLQSSEGILLPLLADIEMGY